MLPSPRVIAGHHALVAVQEVQGEGVISDGPGDELTQHLWTTARTWASKFGEPSLQPVKRAPIAQEVAHHANDIKVVGSNPREHTKIAAHPSTLSHSR